MYLSQMLTWLQQSWKAIYCTAFVVTNLTTQFYRQEDDEWNI